jgi:hypothetical protein
MVKDIVNSKIEHKQATVATASADLATAGVVNAITQQITQGSDINNRDGDMILAEDLRLRVTLRQLGANYVSNSVRLIVFADNLNTGSLPTVAEVLNSANYLSGYYPPNKQKNRFKVYVDTIVDTIGQTNQCCITKDYPIKINRKVFYSASGATSADNGKGALFFLVLAKAASANVYTYEWSWELKYSDA